MVTLVNRAKVSTSTTGTGTRPSATPLKMEPLGKSAAAPTQPLAPPYRGRWTKAAPDRS
jgi:hypothetical protein